MNSSPVGPRPEGTLVCAIALPWPTPWYEIVIFENTEDGGTIRVSYTPHGRLRATIFDEDSHLPLETIQSCPIAMKEQMPLILTILWCLPERMEIHVNSQIVASKAPNSDIPQVFELEFKRNTAVRRMDYSRANALALRQCYQTWVGSAGASPNRKRIPAGLEYMMAALNTEALQLRDLLALSRQGAMHHAIGMASRLRLLIADGKNPLSLLQRCAAVHNAPLILYAGYSLEELPPIKTDLWIDNSFSAHPGHARENPVDVDVWLEFPACITFDHTFTHKAIITAIGNTVAAHLDQDLHKIVFSFMSQKMQVSMAAGVQDFLRIYVMRVAEVVLALAMSVLSFEKSSDT